MRFDALASGDRSVSLTYRDKVALIAPATMEAESETQVLPRRDAPAPAHPASPPKQLDRLVGRYELLHRLGHGGMATVYLGRARGKAGFEKRVAVKVIHPHLANEPELVGMFLDEARIAADLHHPHVVETLDLGEDDGVYFMVMEFIEGETLSALMRSLGTVKMELAVALQVVADACEGLCAAHDLRDGEGRNQHLVHRDVSPQNLMISLDGWVKVADFGIMKAAGKTSHTRPGELRGKLAYMSPEQARGGDVDHRTDLFALGVITWELCTGERLFDGDTDAATLEKVMACEVPAFDREAFISTRQCSAQATETLDAFFKRALSPDPKQRFQSGPEMLSAIRGLQRELGTDADPRQQLSTLMRDKFGKRADYLRASMRDGSPLRRTTRKRSSMVEVAEAARSVTASVIEPTKITGEPTPDEVTPPTMTTNTLVTAPARHWGLWLILPMIGAGLAVAFMSFNREEAPATPAPESIVPAATIDAKGPAEPESVSWHFDTTPSGATVSIGGELQTETTPMRISLPRSEDPVKVVLKKDGFELTTAMLAPFSNQSFSYQLIPLKADAEKEEPPGTTSKLPKKKKPRQKPGGAGESGKPAPASAGGDSGKPKFKPSPFRDKSSDQR